MADKDFDFNLTSLRDKLNKLNNMAAAAGNSPSRAWNSDDFANVSGDNANADINVSKEAGAKSAAERSKAASTNSYASMFKTAGPSNSNSGKKVNFRFLPMHSDIDGIDLVLPIESVNEINSRFSNTLYGYFLGNRLAFPVVENYVKNTWAKFGLQRVMMNDAGFFFFQFSSKQGLEQVLEKGPWMIRSTPILLNIWTPNVCLAKQDTTKIPVWVKIYDVPLVAFTEDGLSMIASKIGNPLMLDSYTSHMCLSSWGRHSYARALIELNAVDAMRKSLVLAIPNISGEGFSKHEMTVEYEWKPPHCDTCKVFGHESDCCPRHVKEVKQIEKQVEDDGFIAVTRRKSKGKERQVEGIKLTKPKPQFVYRPKQPREGPAPSASNNSVKSVSETRQNSKDTSSSSANVIHPMIQKQVNNAEASTSKTTSVRNAFSILGDGVDEYGFDVESRNQERHEDCKTTVTHDSDDDEVEEVYNECLT